MASYSPCSAIVNLYLATSADGIILTRLSWNNEPYGNQSVCVQYRETGDPTWLNATTNLVVDIEGNIEDANFLVVQNPLPGVSYDVQAFNQCGSLPFATTFTYPTNFYSGNYMVDYAIYNICGNDTVILYHETEFGVGCFLFTDSDLVTPLTGYLFVADANSGLIYNVNTGTGEVGAISTYACRTQTSNTVIVGNNTGTICAGTIVTLYSDGEATVGSVLYTDLALSIPVTGSTYVLFLIDNIIYNLNTGTGVIGADTGLSCTANGNEYQYSVVLSDVEDASLVKLYTAGSFGNHAIMYTDYAMTTPLTGYNYIMFEGEIRTIDETTGEVGCLAVNC